MALAWTNGEATATTVIERSLNGSTGWVEIATKNAGVTSHNDTALGNATYYYRVRHLINSVYSSYSSNANGTISGGSSGGSLAVGDTITITGTGFGSGTTPVLFQDFESGTVGASTSTVGFTTATSNGGTEPLIVSDQKYAGTRCGRSDCSVGTESASYVQGLNTDQIYASFHTMPWMTEDPASTLDTVKGFRFHADQGPNVFTSYPGVMHQEHVVFGSKGSRIQQNETNDGSGFAASKNTRSVPRCNDKEWTRQQYHYKLSTPGVADGFVRYWHNAVQSLNWTSVMTRDVGVTANGQFALLPFYWGNGVKGYHYYDLICIHKGPNCAARVELGDAAAYASCTKREILENVSWSDESIQVKLHKHTFGTGTAWLHVIDASNNVVQSHQVTLS